MVFVGDSIGAINMKNIYNDMLSKINQRQRQIIVHSVIYYNYNENIVTDEAWGRWARELVKLQADFPELTTKSAFYNELKGFNASTGFHLADNPWGMHKAAQLLAWRKIEISNGDINH